MRLLALTLLTLPSSLALGASDLPLPATRLELGTGIQGGNPPQAKEQATSAARGEDTRGRGMGLAYGIFGRLDHRIVSWASLAVTGDALLLQSYPGYSERRVDLGLAPRLRPFAPFDLVQANVELYFALPVGLTRSFIREPPRRAFEERDDPELGWYGGVGVGMTLLTVTPTKGITLGAFVELSYTLRRTALRTRYTDAQGLLPTVETRTVSVDENRFACFGLVLAR